MNKIITFIVLLNAISGYAQYNHERVYSTFDNYPLSKLDTFNNGEDLKEGLMHYGRNFHTNYDTIWSSWDGWTLSNMRNDSSKGYSNQYSAAAGSGVSYTANYMLGYLSPTVVFAEPTEVSGAYFTNSTYAYFDMLEGSSFSKKFGGADGNDADFFSLTVFSYLDNVLVDSATLYLADFRNSDNTKDYILNDWTYFDFNDTTTDITVDSLVFVLRSSDNGSWGMNTPAYFCMDDFNAYDGRFLQPYKQGSSLMNNSYYNGEDMAGGFLIDYLFFPNTFNPDWQSWEGWAASTMYDDTSSGFSNQYSAIAPAVRPSGRGNAINYHMVSYGSVNEIRSPYIDGRFNKEWMYKLAIDGPWPLTLGFTNSTYAYFDMLNGSSFSKKFGGPDGNDPDYFRLILDYRTATDSSIGYDTLYLADFRFEDSNLDYILDHWEFLELSTDSRTMQAHKIVLNLESSDNGNWGMNTPAYFCLTLNYDYFKVDDQYKNTAHVKIYPNPANNYLIVETELENVEIEIVDLQGTLHLSSMSTFIDITDLRAGVYLLRVRSGNGFATKRFVKL